MLDRIRASIPALPPAEQHPPLLALRSEAADVATRLHELDVVQVRAAAGGATVGVAPA